MLLLTKLQNLLFLAEKAAEKTDATSMMTSFLPLILLFAVMYFLLIRPQKKKQKQVEQMRSTLIPGNRIVTIGGFVGKVKKVTDDEIYLVLNEGSDHVVIKKWAVQTVLDKEEAKAIEKDSKKSMSEEVPEIEDEVHVEQVDEIENIESEEVEKDN